MNEAAGVGVGVEVFDDVVVDPAQVEAGDLGAFGDVLRDVAGDAGEADVIRTASGETTYRLCGESAAEGPAHHHHHLVCRGCGKAEDVEGKAVETWAAQVAKDAGYVEVDHTVEIFGTCADCATK